MNELKITGDDINERASLELNNLKRFQEKPKKKTGAVWTDERKWGKNEDVGMKEEKRTDAV